MQGVSNWPVFPAGLKTMIDLITLKLPSVPVFNDVPSTPPNAFITVDRVGGDQIAGGYINQPMFAFQCYAPDIGGAEQLTETLLSVLKSAQFTRVGDAQLIKFKLIGGPHNFPDTQVSSRRRWQFAGTFSMK